MRVITSRLKGRCQTLTTIFASTRAYAHIRLCTPRGFCIPKARPLAECHSARDTRSFELGFSQLYTRRIVSRCPPSHLVSASHLISLILSFASFADPHNRTGDAGAFTNCAHNSRTRDHTYAHDAHCSAHLKCWEYGHCRRYEIVSSKVGEQRRRSVLNRHFSKLKVINISLIQ